MEVPALLLAAALVAQIENTPPAASPKGYPSLAVPATNPEEPDIIDPPGNQQHGERTTETPSGHVPEPERLVPIGPPRDRSPLHLFDRYRDLPIHARLEGQPLSLVDALDAPRLSVSGRIAATHAYWRLSGAVAGYSLSNDELETLEGWATGIAISAAGQAILEARMTAALAQVEEARVEVLTAQHELIQKADLLAADRLPLPVDVPHIGNYQTRLNTLYTLGTVPYVVRSIDRLLPVRRRVIQMRSAAVEAAQAALEAVQNEHAAGTGDLSALLLSHDDLARQRRALLTAVVEYNRAIADYALPLAPQGTASGRLAAMLIKPRAAGTSRAIVQPVLPATAIELPAQPSRTIAEPATAAEEPAGGVDPVKLNVPVTPAPRKPLPRIDRPADLPQQDKPPRRVGEPTLAPPVENPQEQPADATQPPRPAAGDAQPKRADPPPAP